MRVRRARAREREAGRLHGIVCGPDSVVGSRLRGHHGRQMGVGARYGVSVWLESPRWGGGQLSLLFLLPHGESCTVHKIAISYYSRYSCEGVDGGRVVG